MAEKDKKSKNDNPLSVYAVVSQLAFNILTPLLVFIVGGYFATDYFGWEDWAMAVCVVLGIVTMICCALSYLSHLIRLYGKENKNAPRSFDSPSDKDYYDN